MTNKHRQGAAEGSCKGNGTGLITVRSLPHTSNGLEMLKYTEGDKSTKHLTATCADLHTGHIIDCINKYMVDCCLGTQQEVSPC